MPTFAMLARFRSDYALLSEDEKEAFWRAIRELIDDLDHGRRIRHSLRPKRLKGTTGIWEITWGNDGRATFAYGPSLSDGKAHVIWRRVGTHDILRAP